MYTCASRDWLFYEKTAKRGSIKQWNKKWIVCILQAINLLRKVVTKGRERNGKIQSDRDKAEYICRQ